MQSARKRINREKYEMGGERGRKGKGKREMEGKGEERLR